MRNISFSDNTWKRLREVKDSQELKHLGQAVNFLLDHYDKSESFLEERTTISEHLHDNDAVLKGENQPELQQSNNESSLEETTNVADIVSKTVPDIQEPDPKLWEAIIGSESWSQVQKLMASRNSDLPAAMRYLINCYKLISREEPVQKLEGFRDLQEIHEHIKKMDVGYDAGLMDIPKVYSEKAWIVCPICRSSFLLWSESSEDKPEPGITFEFVDGHNQRHFRGVDNEYLPYQIRMGNEIITEKSLTINTLKLLDRKLYDHILNVIKNTFFSFGGRQGL